MADQKYVPEQADQLISFSSRNEDGTWESGIIGSIVFPENRNARPSGVPYVKGKMIINMKKLMEAVNSGLIKTSKSGYAYVEVNPPLTDEQKAKFAEPKQQAAPAAPAAAPKAKTWGNNTKPAEVKQGWGKKAETPF